MLSDVRKRNDGLRDMRVFDQIGNDYVLTRGPEF